jgi:hypothetical protein
VYWGYHRMDMVWHENKWIDIAAPASGFFAPSSQTQRFAVAVKKNRPGINSRAAPF